MGDLILTEVLQGFRADKDYRTAKALFEDIIIFDLGGKDMAIKSAGLNSNAVNSRVATGAALFTAS